MKKSLTLLLILFSALSFASLNSELLTKEDFNKMSEFKYNWVLNAERMFTDDLIAEDLYQVTFYVEGECASNGEVDACEQIEVCEYGSIDTSAKSKSNYYPTFTNVECAEDIEDVLNPILIDEY